MSNSKIFVMIFKMTWNKMSRPEDMARFGMFYCYILCVLVPTESLLFLFTLCKPWPGSDGISGDYCNIHSVHCHLHVPWHLKNLKWVDNWTLWGQGIVLLRFSYSADFNVQEINLLCRKREFHCIKLLLRPLLVPCHDFDSLVTVICWLVSCFKWNLFTASTGVFVDSLYNLSLVWCR